jgi:hypothetical protein
MDWAGLNSLDQVWRSPAFPMWLTLAAAGFFGLILLITLVRAERSVANGALTVITLLAIGVAVAATMRFYGPPTGKSTGTEGRPQPIMSAALPALNCLDDLAGDAVLAACEKVVFGSPETAAGAVAYTAAQISRLVAVGDVADANKTLTPEFKALRRAVERDRYGLVAQVLIARDGCTPFDCAAFRSLTDQQQVATNMDSHLYDTLVARYAPTWNMPQATAPAALAALPPSMPTGKPTNADFPSAASTPAVSIMAPEPTRPASTGTAAPPATARSPAAASAQASTPPTAAAKKQQSAKSARPVTPVQIAPPAPQPPAAPAADNE